MRKIAALSITALVAGAAFAGPPKYTIVDLGVVDPGDIGSQGLNISPGGVAVGRSLGVSNIGFSYTTGGGLIPLPNDSTRPFGQANGANDNGIAVGTGATTFFGSGALPLQWIGGSVEQLPIVPGSGVGRANDVNNSGLVVGSNGGGSGEFAAYWSGGAVNPITATTGGGATMTTAHRVNDAGQAVGNGIDPNNLARNVALMYDTNSGTLTEIPALAGHNGGIAFDISENSYVVGSSSFNQSDSMPFIWSSGTGSVGIPLPSGASTGSARGVNSDGWVVGIGSGVFALPFLYDGGQTYLLQDLIPAASGWDLSTNTSSSALGISEDGSITGTGSINGNTHAYYMTLVPAPGGATILGIGAIACMRRRR